ncbi:MAG: hypothetical protein ACREUY_04620, partial [Burkholderiales bacterium]
LLGWQTWAHAGRILPPNGVKDELQDSKYPYVLIGGSRFHLAPGSRIFDQNNRIILPNYLPLSATVLYQLDGNGDLINMWLLTPEEAASSKK